jgi:hypothetical protein
VPLAYFGGQLITCRDEVGMVHVADGIYSHLGVHLIGGAFV